MKKVLIAFDGRHFSHDVFDFVNEMNKEQPVLAVGVFLPSADYIELLYSYGGIPAGPLFLPDETKGDDKLLEKNIARFSQLCEEHNIKYKIHRDFTDHVVTQMKNETRFADLLVLNSGSFYENLREDTQKDYLVNVLHKSECPVVLLPGKYKRPAGVILAYDGSEQSVYAIKQFAYMFPGLCNRHALLVYFGNNKKGVPERNSIEELAGLHFKNLTIAKLKITSDKDIEKWMSDNGNSMLVAGAFGRSVFSELFRKSFISNVIMDHKIPVFVAHK